MPNTENHIIERLPRSVQIRFLERCEFYELVPSTELSARGTTLTHAYFPNSGSISLVSEVGSQPAIEVGVESMLGSELLLGVAKTPWRSVVQGAGNCWRIETSALRQALTDMQALQALLQRNLMVRVRQHQALASAAALSWAA